MNTSDLRFPAGFDAGAQRGEIRWQLFLDHDVREVEPTSRPDTLRVHHHGAPDLPQWTAALAEEDFPAPVLVAESALQTSRG